jgi:hypothetical protein
MDVQFTWGIYDQSVQADSGHGEVAGGR